ncbi:DUF3237 domain-containing protein [Variovorax sp. RCC_210]|uniref:DUF3237 domain-containing protein n=1 Tax=Variovorax sp. RCC_210 TaxID=3239217 RepID=UPI0035250AE6
MSDILINQPLLEEPRLEALPIKHLCDLQVDLETPLIIPTPRGALIPYIGKGGRLEGPRLRGEFLPDSVDWVLIGSDGISRLDIRGAIRTDDGALIYFESKGVAKLPPDGRKRLSKGERVGFGETYLPTTPKTETSDERYTWLNEHVLVGYNAMSTGRVDFRIYQVL